MFSSKIKVTYNAEFVLLHIQIPCRRQIKALRQNLALYFTLKIVGRILFRFELNNYNIYFLRVHI